MTFENHRNQLARLKEMLGKYEDILKLMQRGRRLGGLDVGHYRYTLEATLMGMESPDTRRKADDSYRALSHR